MRFWPFILSFLLMLIFTYAVSTGLLFAIEKNIPSHGINFFILWLITSTITFGSLSSYHYSKTVLPLKRYLTIGSIQIDNPFYDQSLVEKVENENYYKKYVEYQGKLEDTERIVDELLGEILKLEDELENEYELSNIFIRHHLNSSRLVRSFSQLINEGNAHWKYEFINNVLDECGTVLMKNNADKSSSVYFINTNNKLEMFAYNRIEFSSSRNRTFGKGEGFAGEIWEKNESILINDVTISEYFTGDYVPKHKYGSIIGVPISIGNKVYGVLNIQSEYKNAFIEDDLTSVRFYADICALAHLYDILTSESTSKGVG